MRWRWIATNPIAQAVPPPQPKPNPQSRTSEQAGCIFNEAWKDPDWAVLIWLTMVTGFRRGELCAIRWRHLDLAPPGHVDDGIDVFAGHPFDVDGWEPADRWERSTGMGLNRQPAGL